MTCIITSSLALIVLLSARTAQSLDISIPTKSPESATKVDPALFSFSIEQDRWPDWVINTTTGVTNQFTLNAWKNLRELTDTPPYLRIGADSEDRTNFDPAVQYAETIFGSGTASTPYPEASNVTVGPGFYELAKLLLPGTHVTWGVNLKSYNLTATYLETKAIAEVFESTEVKDAGIQLEYIEIGNEPNLYAPKYRPSDWNITQWVDQWTAFAYNVTATARISNSSYTKFWGCAFGGKTTGFSPELAFANGLLDSEPGSLITAISQHQYAAATSVEQLITPSYVRERITEYATDIADVQSQGLKYIFGEANTDSGHGTPNVSDVAGSALWVIDFSLFASTQGVERIYYHEGIGYKYNFIQPVTLCNSPDDFSVLNPPEPPHVQPIYYGAIIGAEAIGKSGSVETVELATNSSSSFIVGYAFYESGTLRRALFSNAQAYLSNSTSPRTSTQISLSFNGTALEKMTVKRLAVPYADSRSGLTWGGQTYETSDALVSGELNVTTVSVSDGFSISETEVVLLTF